MLLIAQQSQADGSGFFSVESRKRRFSNFPLTTPTIALRHVKTG